MYGGGKAHYDLSIRGTDCNGRWNYFVVGERLWERQVRCRRFRKDFDTREIFTSPCTCGDYPYTAEYLDYKVRIECHGSGGLHQSMLPCGPFYLLCSIEGFRRGGGRE